MNFRHRTFSDGWPSDREAFGAMIKRTRLAAGLTRRRLAELAELSFFTFLHIEAGDHLPSSDKRARLIKALQSVGAVQPDADTDHKKD